MSNEIRTSGIVRAITKSDTVDIPQINGMSIRAVFCGTAGTCSFLDATNTLVTDFPLQVGVNPIKPMRILNSGTAANLWALY